jgi:hypothetical protein
MANRIRPIVLSAEERGELERLRRASARIWTVGVCRSRPTKGGAYNVIID